MSQGMVRFSELSRYRRFKALGECAISLFIFYNLVLSVLAWAEPLLPQTDQSAAMGAPHVLADHPPVVSHRTERVVIHVWRHPATQRSPQPSHGAATRAAPHAEPGFGTVQNNFDRMSQQSRLVP